MIRILLKHLVYEKCIDVFFDNILVNFPSTHKQIIRGRIIDMAERSVGMVQDIRAVMGISVEQEFLNIILYEYGITSKAGRFEWVMEYARIQQRVKSILKI